MFACMLGAVYGKISRNIYGREMITCQANDCVVTRGLEISSIAQIAIEKPSALVGCARKPFMVVMRIM